MQPISRRAFLASLAVGVCARGHAAAIAPGPDALKRGADGIAAIERQDGGRLGVMILDAGSPARLAHRADERFPMCSTFKLLACAAVLKRVDDGQDRLDRIIAYGPSDLLEYAPVAKTHVADGGMRLGDLCAAAIDWSDNTAGNLILAAVGGPSGFTAFARSLGDAETRLDRNEPSLNESTPGDDRDTTTPLAMAEDLRIVLLGEVLSEASRARLDAWLAGDKVGDKRLRAGLPPSWAIGDKTGSGDHGTANAIGIIRPPARPPLLAAVYYTGSDASMDDRNRVHRQVAGVIAETFAS
jgi:beta-lactamase class A